MRKLLVGFFSLGVVFAVYILYTGTSDTRMPEADPGADLVESAADSNLGDFDSNVGKIGDIGLGPVHKAYFINVNKETNELEREWGFEKLLHETEGFWELEKPYVNVFETDFTCYITADRGLVQVETAVGWTAAKDATFTGNVVVHVLPKESSELKECFVYLDDMTFLSERSQLATPGPVEFVSDDVHMLGTGLTIIFNDQSDRLEFFRIVDLETLRIKGSQAAMFSSGETEMPAETVAKAKPPATLETPAEPEAQAEPETQAEPEQPDETVVAAGPQQEDTEQPPQAAQTKPEQKEGVLYKCVLSRNVLIETPTELIFTDQGILISDIFWSKDSVRRSGAGAPGDANDTEAVAVAGEESRDVDPNRLLTDSAGEPGDTDDTEAVTTSGGEDHDVDPNSVLADSTIEASGALADSTVEPNVVVTASADPNSGTEPPGEPNESPGEIAEIVVTCDNGLVLVPADTARSLDGYIQSPEGAEISPGVLPAQIAGNQERTAFLAPRIDYNATTGDVVADGFSELTFYARNSTDAEVNEPPVPTKITARDTVEFFKATNQVVFKGDCKGTRPQDGLTEPRNVTFLSPEITVNLPADKSGQPDVLATGPAELTFYMQDANDIDAAQDANIPSTPEEPIPVTVTAQKQARFSGATNQIVFEGDCNCVTVREDANGVTEYKLLSELITVDLPEDTNDRTTGSTARIERLTATGGVVRLASTKTARPDPNQAGYVSDANAVELLGGVELKCSRVEYDLVGAMFTAAGPPAEIRVDNSKVSTTESEPNAPGLSEPCYVLIQNFDTLKYFMGENRVVADASAGDEGHNELATLTATGGIAFDDDANNSIFLGSKLFYDHKTSIMKITGDASRPCLCNGVLVDEIKYNVVTRSLDFNVVAPGAMQTND
jgi:hypothetical protein